MAKKQGKHEKRGEVLGNAKETALVENYWHVLGKGRPRKPRKKYKYVEELAHLQIELIKLQESVRTKGLRVCCSRVATPPARVE